MKQVVDYSAYVLFRATIALLLLLPRELRVFLLELTIRTVFFLAPRYRRICLKNLDLAFPGNLRRQHEILEKSFGSLARLLSDVMRFSTLSEKWLREQITFPGKSAIEKLRQENPGKGILMVTGHLGSFELLAYASPTFGRALHFVIRRMKNPYINEWWVRTRERTGNKVIEREGAFKQILRTLKAGTDVGILFDQNVTRNHALFVPWFGRKAATTKAVGLAALATEAPTAVAAIYYQGKDRYEVVIEPCDCTDIYNAPQWSKDEKVQKITERLTKRYEELIMRQPEGWFWMHRRWKTTPEGELEGFY